VSESVCHLELVPIDSEHAATQAHHSDGEWVEQLLPYTPPLDSESLLAFLGARAIPGVEEYADGAYRRSLQLPGGPGMLELQPVGDRVRARYRLADRGDLDRAAKRTRALLDLDSDPQAVLGALGGDPVIGSLVRATPGRRVPGHVDAHELAVRAVLGQQVSVAGAVTHAARLVAAYGEPLAHPVGGVTHLFPSAAAVAAADPDRLAMPRSRRRTLISLAAALADRELALDAESHRARARRALLALPGIGPWTTEYIAMRALGDRDAFLETDLGVKRAVELLGLDSRPAAILELAEGWRPYRAYALVHLWAYSPTIST
jgi:AraC family transcriptional regulator, regulatory protein of adaptative response / DNA-3-methyladenine glycosylase II